MELVFPDHVLNGRVGFHDFKNRRLSAVFCGDKLLADVAGADAEALAQALSKTNLLRWIGQQETAELSFTKLKDGVPTPYTLQTIKSRESDTNHIVLGVREGKGGTA